MDSKGKVRPPKGRFWALIIGINEYKFLGRPLKGAIADAQSMKSFLTSNLSVPEHHIRTLLGPEATHANMLTYFKTHLTLNRHIREGDAIIFYFAGHGTRCAAPDGWSSVDNQCEAICPWDVSPRVESGKSTVYPIPDRTLWALLHELAREKGNNITVILDCCHSGSGTRGVPVTNGLQETVRSVPCSLRIPPSLDEEIWGKFFTRQYKAHIPYGFRFGHMSSHVLLAACRQDEKALETNDTANPRGKFTTALLSGLRRLDQRTTYEGLISSLPDMFTQHPQCEGNNKDCFLFTVDGNKRTHPFIVTSNRDARSLEITAGAMHGVTTGTVFSVYPRKDSTDAPLGYLKAHLVDLASCTVSPISPREAFVLPGGTALFARISSFKDPSADPGLRVYISSRLGTALADRIFTSETLLCGIRRANNRAEADFVIEPDMRSTSLALTRTSRFLAGHSPEYTHTNVRADPRAILRILQAAAHVKAQLLRPSSGMIPGFEVQLHRLLPDKRAPELHLPYKRVPLETFHPGFSRSHLAFDPSAAYGLTLSNQSPYELFPFVFIYDLKTYQVARWYLPPSRSAQAPLKRGTQLSVGHGNLDTFPLSFTLEHGQNFDQTFFSLVVSTENPGMEWMEQDNAFEDTANRAGNKKKRLDCVWDSRVVSVTYSR